MPHTHYTTLISATNLAERLAEAPGSVFVIDCRFDLADPEAGEKAYLAGHLPGAAARRSARLAAEMSVV